MIYRFLRRYRWFFGAFLLLIGSCHVGRSIWYFTSDITDYKIFPERPVSNDSIRERLPSARNPSFPNFIKYDDKLTPDSVELGSFLRAHKTVAFLILWRDSIQYEGYFNGYVDSSVTVSFSMAKSVVSLLLGCAIEDGYLEGVEEPILKYVPEFEGRGFDSLKILHLLQMTAGLDFKEKYSSPFTTMPKFYYGRHITKNTLKLKSDTAKQNKFDYQSPSTQILALILTRALKGKTLSGYLEEKIWKPMQMEYPASWSLDEKDGMEKAFCCLNARARDFAKLGLLVKNYGEWKGKQLVPRKWIQQSRKRDTSNGSAKFYQYQWWLDGLRAMYANGHLGQYIYIVPGSDLVIVRLGKDYGGVNWPYFMNRLSSKYAMDAYQP